jgi:hypothetical protein
MLESRSYWAALEKVSQCPARVDTQGRRGATRDPSKSLTCPLDPLPPQLGAWVERSMSGGAASMSMGGASGGSGSQAEVGGRGGTGLRILCTGCVKMRAQAPGSLSPPPNRPPLTSDLPIHPLSRPAP